MSALRLEARGWRGSQRHGSGAAHRDRCLPEACASSSVAGARVWVGLIRSMRFPSRHGSQRESTTLAARLAFLLQKQSSDVVDDDGRLKIGEAVDLAHGAVRVDEKY